MSLDLNDLSNYPTSAHGHGITCRNVNDALPLALSLLHMIGKPVMSRGMATLEAPGPVSTVYMRPWENVLFDPVRDANPFFHFFESLWILAGKNTLAMPRYFLDRYSDYSDDGETLHGAYGYRLRHWERRDADGGLEHIDQLEAVVRLLTEKPDTRQAVLSIWNPVLDLGVYTKDMPCNDMIMFKIRNGKLQMTVCCRSNDIIWGCYGANAVQFTFLQAWVAARLGVGIGPYVQMSDSWHAYVDNNSPLWGLYVDGKWKPEAHVVNPYEHLPPTTTSPMFVDSADAESAINDAVLLNDLAERGWMHKGAMLPRSAFESTLGKGTMRPMLAAFVNFRAKDYQGAVETASKIELADWRYACESWLTRRQERANAV